MLLIVYIFNKSELAFLRYEERTEIRYESGVEGLNTL
jgi:hypothetical protein